MAGIESVTLNSPSNTNVGINKAKISCSCDKVTPPETQYSADKLTKYEYGNGTNETEYTWRFYLNGTLDDIQEEEDRSVTYKPSTLKAGAANSIYATVQGYCTEYTYKRATIDDSWDTKATSKTLVRAGLSKKSNVITIYTRPGQFSSVDNNFMSIKQGETIQASTGLTAKSVEAWCTHCGKHLSWRDRADRYSAANSCKVSSKDLITAKWYNSCAELCGLIDVEKEKTMRKTNKDYNDPNRVFAGQTLITAEIIKKLGTKISTSEIT
jgi:hypothetical protein